MRDYLILKAFAERKEYLPLSFFMDELNVSKRTVQNELSYLRKVAEKHGYTLKNMYGKGYFIEVNDQEKFACFIAELKAEENISSEKELLFEELSILLNAGSDFITVEQMAEKLQFSKTLLFEKMATLATYIDSYQLQLQRKSHFGIRIIGEAVNIRRLMMDMYLNGNHSFQQMTDQRVGNFTEYERLLEDCIQANDLRIGYYEFQQIVTWLKVLLIYSLNFKQNNNFSKMPVIDFTTEHLKDFAKLLEKLSVKFQIVIETDEILEFFEVIRHCVQEEKQVDVLDDARLYDALKEFLQQIDIENSTDFSSDQEFIYLLQYHLKLLVKRLDQKIRYKNPMLLDLCIRYPMIFDIALKFSTFFYQKYGYKISNDELGFIAVHFLGHLETEKQEKLNRYKNIAVICTTGGGISNLIKNQIQTIFPNSTIKAYPFWQKDNINDFKPGLIFSAVPLQESIEVPIIYIKELLTTKDLENIRQFLFLKDEPAQEPVTNDIAKEYLKFFIPALFTVRTINSYEELIRTMAKEMIAAGYGDENLEKNVLIRERYMSTVFKNGIAMPHPIEMKARKSAIGVAVVKPELIEKDRQIKIVFLICLSKADFQLYGQIANGLFQLMKSEADIRKVYDHPVLTELLKVLSEMEA